MLTILILSSIILSGLGLAEQLDVNYLEKSSQLELNYPEKSASFQRSKLNSSRHGHGTTGSGARLSREGPASSEEAVSSRRGREPPAVSFNIYQGLGFRVVL